MSGKRNIKKFFNFILKQLYILNLDEHQQNEEMLSAVTGNKTRQFA
jgi:hypothetical protein